MNGDSNLEVLPSIPKDIIFPDELNRYLRGQIEYLMHENGMLRKNLQENESSLNENKSIIDNLKNKLKEYENTDNKHQYTTSTALASSKIVELSRKLREKNAEVESYKTKCSKLEKQIFEIYENKTEEPQKEMSPAQRTEREDQLKKLQDKLSASSMRFRELQNMNIHLKNELKMANKYLQQEVGDTLDTISNNNNLGWRGRAQIICDLQQKNQELKEKLKGYQKKSGVEVNSKAEKKLDNLIKENEDLKNILEEQKKRIDVLRARCKVLEGEQSINKSKIASLIAQTERDQNLMQTLSNQVSNQQNVTNETIKQKDKHIKGLQQDNEVLRIELSKQRYTVENLTKDLNDKMEEIKDLMRNKRKSPRPSSSYGQRNKNLIDERLVNRLEAEKSRLLELTEVQASRISAEREAHSKTQERLMVERQKAARLETNLAKLELEYSSIRSGGSYCTLTTNRSIDGKKNTLDFKDELEIAQETIKALKTRLEIEQHERKVDLKEFARILELHK
ncbi:protein lava lamp-like isoform X2 [Coccinella septempunctata]|uniref:protein lava lamp-like isoform X2 n=1 Tax=Coccinella septempunctata TaxID=41139 RepID=UPI001D094959|nr:protein lava lamp-like isoform X2 [Coccinella septempunctata]